MGQIVSDVTEILDYKNAKQETKSQRKEILNQMAAQNAEKNNLVKKALASQRAKYGASGMRADGVTEGAVLKRMKDEIEKPYEDKKKETLNKLKKTKTKKPNLLESLLSKLDGLM
ncbi:MAG: hypothetical protein R8N24_04600 [Alphaproteobacteria bacterium]|jgi:cobalamin biosynthesis protein CbiD|nr:hypothetical protein [Alphaproteobacteria bacterium]